MARVAHAWSLSPPPHHHSVKRRLGIWLRPMRCAFVSFLNFMLSSKPEACKGGERGEGRQGGDCLPQSVEQPPPLTFSQKRPSHVGKYVPLKSVCSRMPSTPPSAWMTSVR